jgi:hypothetical protein
MKKAALATIDTVNETNNEKILVNIAKYNLDPVVAETAIKKISTGYLLNEIVKESKLMASVGFSEDRIMNLRNSRSEEWKKAPVPMGETVQKVDSWFRLHEGKKVFITFYSIIDGDTYEGGGSWIVSPPVSLNPMIWELPSIHGFYRDKKEELFCLMVDEDYALVMTDRVSAPIKAYHEVEIEEGRMLYRIAFGSSGYESGDDYITHSSPTRNGQNVELWQKYIFKLT